MPTEKTTAKMKLSANKRISGGSATAGGMNFQAAVSAIVGVHIARGRPLGWLEGIVDDIPVSLLAETGTSGDDLQIHLSDSIVVEAQVKKGLSAGQRLWEPLVGMAKALSKEKAGYALLIVCPNSSATIRSTLERDIRRMGDGRRDKLGTLAQQFLKRLQDEGINAEKTCQRLRIVTLNCLHGNDASVAAARSDLELLCVDSAKVSQAWDCLYRDACSLIETRGARNASSIARILKSKGIEVASSRGEMPVALISRLANFVLDTTRQFEVIAARKPLSMDDDWIPSNVAVQETPNEKILDPVAALDRYHSWYSEKKSSRRDLIAPETLGWFYRQCVIVGGPGIGKSTLLAKLARSYAEESYPVLRVKLRTVAARMRAQGDSFEDAIFALGIDGSGISPAVAKSIGIKNWVFLCDGLDECAADQKDIVQGLVSLKAGNPDARIVVSTRPIGYDSALLADWRHYELLPMDESSHSLEKLDLVIHALAQSEADAKAASEFAAKQLKGNDASNLVTRSPMLLTMVAVLAVKGASIGTTKTSLYERFFELVCDLPNQRRSVSTVSPVILRRFLEIVAWEVLADPAETRNGIVRLCAGILGMELNESKLKSQSIAEEACQYWEDIGLLERVNFGEGETVTYVHKTLAEFAAAQHLVAMDDTARASAIHDALKSKEMKEVVSFAAQNGLNNEIAECIFADEASYTNDLEATKHLLSIIADSSTPINKAVSDKILARAFRYVVDDRPWTAYEIGKLLVSVCARLPEDIAAIALKYADHKQEWTSFVSWTCLIVAKPDNLDLSQLKDAYVSLPRSVKPSPRKSLGGVFHLRSNEANDLLEKFVVGGARVILSHCPAEEADKILPQVLADKSLYTMRMYEKIKKLIGEYNKDYGLDKVYKFDSLASMNWSEYGRAWHAFFKKLFAIIASAAGAENDSPVADTNFIRSPRVPYLSAFVQLSGFWELPASNVWSWVEDFDDGPVLEIVNGLISITGLPRDHLARESRQILQYIDSDPEEQGLLLGLFDHVDVQELDWDDAASLGLNLSKIEDALHRQCEWTLFNGGNLLSHAASPTVLHSVTKRLLANGSGLTLWVAAQFATELDKDKALDLIYERLSGNIIPGYRYIVSILGRLDTPVDERLFAVAERGLLAATVTVACAVASLLEDKLEARDSIFHPLLLRAYKHWLEHEEPYPEHGGVVPDSPRAKLLKAMERLSPSSDAEVIERIQDSRSDVRDIAKEELQRRLLVSENMRQAFLESVQSNTRLAPFLSTALRDHVPFSAQHIEIVLSLVSSPTPEIRYAAIDVLDINYVSSEQARYWCSKLKEDSEADVRNRARRLMDAVVERA